MRVVPHFTADFDEYPELRTIAPIVVRRVAELMELHDIAELKRIRKTGIFEHPYTKDVIRPINVTGVPDSIATSRHTAGAALLDYLESVGLSGLGLELDAADVSNIAALWNPQEPGPQTTKAVDGADAKNPEAAKPGERKDGDDGGDPPDAGDPPGAGRDKGATDSDINGIPHEDGDDELKM